MHLPHLLRTALLLTLLSGLAAGCSRKQPADRPLVTVTIEPLRYVTEQLAGDIYDVTTLTPAGASPETYQPTPGQMVALSRSRAFIRMGTLGFERTQLEKFTSNIPHLICINASKGIPPLATDSAAGSDSADPHAWTSPRDMKHIARNICDALCALDTAHVRTFTSRLKAFSHRMDSLEAALRRRLRQAPSRTFLIYHPALGYFARTFGLRQLSVEQDGKEASPRRVADLVGQCRRDSVRVVFIQKEYSGETARRIAEAAGARVAVINPLSYQWEEELEHIVEELCR